MSPVCIILFFLFVLCCEIGLISFRVSCSGAPCARESGDKEINKNGSILLSALLTNLSPSFSFMEVGKWEDCAMKGRALIGCVVQFVWIYFFFHLRRKKVGGVVQVVLSSGRCIFFFSSLSYLKYVFPCCVFLSFSTYYLLVLFLMERNGMEWND